MSALKPPSNYLKCFCITKICELFGPPNLIIESLIDNNLCGDNQCY